MSTHEAHEATLFVCGRGGPAPTRSLAGPADVESLPDVPAAERAGAAFSRHVGLLAFEDDPGGAGFGIARALAPLVRHRTDGPVFVAVGRGNGGRPVTRGRAGVIARGLGATVLVAARDNDGPPGDLLVPVLEAYFTHGLVCFDAKDLWAMCPAPAVAIQFRWCPGDEGTGAMPADLRDVLGDPTGTGLFVHLRTGENGTLLLFDEVIRRVAEPAAANGLVHAFVVEPGLRSVEAFVTVFFAAE